jgi:hypothetical protein
MDQIIGVIVGGALGIGGSMATKYWDSWREAKSLRASLAAEIAAILVTAKMRNHESNFRALLAQWKAGNNLPVTASGVDLAMTGGVYEANVSKIGLIGADLAARVVRFHFELLAMRITFKTVEDGSFQQLPLAAKIAETETLLDLWDGMTVRAENLVKDL